MARARPVQAIAAERVRPAVERTIWKLARHQGWGIAAKPLGFASAISLLVPPAGYQPHFRRRARLTSRLGTFCPEPIMTQTATMTYNRTASGRSTTGDAAAIAVYIRTRGVTRCPTACAMATQATIPAADQAALAQHGLVRERARQQRMAAAAHAFGNYLTAPQNSGAAEG